MINSLYPFARKWSEKGSIYLISDPHFDDADCKLISFAWPEPYEYITNLKKKIHKNDTLICLGDVGNPEYFKQLDCYKVLIKGNHDKGNSNYERKITFKYDIADININVTKENLLNELRNEYPYENIHIDIYDNLNLNYPCVRVKIDNNLFDEVYDGPLFISEKLLLSHEPIICGDSFFNIHGHIHDKNYIENYNEMNIAANYVNYNIISLGDLIKDGILSRVCGQHRLTIDKVSK